MASSEFCTADWVKACIRRVKAALIGLERLSDAEAAAYLNANQRALDRLPGMPATMTAAIVHEARVTVI